ncbi:hypothetical protein EJ03DRAFT_357967 [Teratosphaeria nubilosa]|uniref:Uncharacterized protein n=1 Tax=Teratosphaeria nubilosa TaxID=161662 RepID=A0A6G1KV97_9PEZI|nr:hypothetical protein EJ03DRAFT_357967 [Teratosphaeria nubilosa]
MVRTRHSLPTASTTDDIANLTEKQRAALKSLQIDAHDAILSGQRGGDRAERKVYHWRGAVYECQGDEPGDWLGERERGGAGWKRKREGEGVLGVKKPRRTSPRNVTPKARISPAAAVIDVHTRGHSPEPQPTQAGREAAQRKGYQISTLPEESIVNARGKWLAGKVCAMAKLNRRALALVEQYNGVRRWIWERENGRESEHSPSEQRQEVPESPEPQWTTKDKTTTTSTTKTIVRTRTTTSHSRPAAFTTTAKGGQAVRWSIDPCGSDNALRAEEAIFHGRLDGESKQARRRRIRRELNSIKSWDRLPDDTP